MTRKIFPIGSDEPESSGGGGSGFAPTPQHGAAYAVAIEAVGGAQAISACSTREQYEILRRDLDELYVWSGALEEKSARIAYAWGIEKVDKDLKGRLAVHENSRLVRQALAVLPRPPRRLEQ